MLFSHLRIHQIFGANTDVGKTIFSTILSLATAARNRQVFYLKPVSTGAARDADDAHIMRFTPKRAKITSKTMVQMDSPVSPHLAAMESPTILTDGGLIGGIVKHIYDCAANNKINSDCLASLYIETAGGVLSPAPSGTLQADAYRPLRLPTVLVADSKLGGISTTITAYESLNSRGYDVDSVVMFIDQYYRNHQFLKEWFSERGVKLTAMEPPPLRQRNKKRAVDEKKMQQYYAHTSTTSDARAVIDLLDTKHQDRIKLLRGMPQRAINSFWYPFVQHQSIRSPEDIMTVDSAHRDVFTAVIPPSSTANQKSELLAPKFDGSASWWTQGVGHGNPKLNAAASYAAGRYGHVIFPQVVHEPALILAENLLKTQGAGWASRAFFSDNGSTGMEVALKMALRTTATLYPLSDPKPELEVLGLSGSYHGDTLGAMDASEGGIYNSTVEWYKGRGLWLDPPILGFENGRLVARVPWDDHHEEIESLGVAYDVHKRRDTSLDQTYRNYIKQAIIDAVKAGRQFGALVMEPLVLGAGGMRFVDPLFQTAFVEVVRTMSEDILPGGRTTHLNSVKTLPVIFDEVFTGLGRLGFSSPSSLLDAKPDIAVYAKLLTGGLVPMAVTLASNNVFAAFLGDQKAAALLHGHSYTAYPVGCAVANTSLELLKKALKGEHFQAARRQWGNQGGKEIFSVLDIPPETMPSSLWSSRFVEALSRKPGIARVMTLGTVLAFELKSGISGYGSSAAEHALAPLKGNGGVPALDKMSVHLRTLGNVGYLITSLTTEKHDIRRVEAQLLQCFTGGFGDP